MITYNTTENITIELTPEESEAVENTIVYMHSSEVRRNVKAKIVEATKKRDEANERARAGTARETERRKIHLQPKKFELHVSPYIDGFTKRFGKRIRATGGKYTHCRGYTSHRSVEVPNTEEGRALVDEILKSHADGVFAGTRKVTVIALGVSGQSLPAWVTVHRVKNVAEFLKKMSKAIDQAVERDIIKAAEVV